MSHLSKRRDVGLAASLVMLVQFATGYQANQNFSSEMVKLRDEVHHAQIDREMYFVRKSEIKELSNKIDVIHDEVIALKIIVKDKYASIDENEEIIGCSVEKPLENFYVL